MYQKLFILATIALTAVSAHPGTHAIVNATAVPATNFKFSETFPEAGAIPTAKPEWLELIKNVEIAKAPVYKVGNGLGKYIYIFTYMHIYVNTSSFFFN